MRGDPSARFYRLKCRDGAPASRAVRRGRDRRRSRRTTSRICSSAPATPRCSSRARAIRASASARAWCRPRCRCGAGSASRSASRRRASCASTAPTSASPTASSPSTRTSRTRAAGSPTTRTRCGAPTSTRSSGTPRSRPASTPATRHSWRGGAPRRARDRRAAPADGSRRVGARLSPTVGPRDAARRAAGAARARSNLHRVAHCHYGDVIR